MTDRAIYIVWTEATRVFVSRRASRVAGSGELVAVFDDCAVKRSARYSSDVSPDVIARAQAYCDSDEAPAGARVEIREDE